MTAQNERPTRPIFFLHVSSSGGTSLCRWAQQQPCSRVPACGSNCNLNCQHPWDWRRFCRPPACALPEKACRAPYQPGCEGLARYARRRNLTFLASETLLPAYCFDTFTYITVLRDPIARLQSLALRLVAQPNTWLRRVLEQPYVFNTSTSSSLIGTAALDNFLTRLLLGPSAFFLPLRGINESHFRAASDVLASFALAIPIERFEDHGAALLRAKFGWRGSPARSNSHQKALLRKKYLQGDGRRLSSRLSTSAAPSRMVQLGERTVRVLRELNKYDLHLIEQARSRFNSQLREVAELNRSTTEPSSVSHHHCALGHPSQCPLTGRPMYHLGVV